MMSRLPDLLEMMRDTDPVDIDLQDVDPEVYPQGLECRAMVIGIAKIMEPPWDHIAPFNHVCTEFLANCFVCQA